MPRQAEYGQAAAAAAHTARTAWTLPGSQDAAGCCLCVPPQLHSNGLFVCKVLVTVALKMPSLYTHMPAVAGQAEGASAPFSSPMKSGPPHATDTTHNRTLQSDKCLLESMPLAAQHAPVPICKVPHILHSHPHLNLQLKAFPGITSAPSPGCLGDTHFPSLFLPWNPSFGFQEKQ